MEKSHDVSEEETIIIINITEQREINIGVHVDEPMQRRVEEIVSN